MFFWVPILAESCLHWRADDWHYYGYIFPDRNVMYLSVARIEQSEASQNQGQLIFLLSKRKQRK